MIFRTWLLLTSRRVAPQRSLWIRRFQSTASGNTLPSPTLLQRAQSLAAEHDELSRKLNEQYDAEIAKKVGSLSAVAGALRAYNEASSALPELQQLVQGNDTDAELKSLASDELEQTSARLPTLSAALTKALVPQHPFSHLPCLIELRPGVGGNEAALFAGDLLRMYQAYCKRHAYPCNLLKLDSAASNETEEQVQEAILEIPLPGAYSIFRCEAGVHRVQRVPATEAKGRTHTSAASVLVLPAFPEAEAEGTSDWNDPNSDYFINPSDVRTDTMRASGAGGQHVNKTESAIRLTHIPSGIVVSMQDSRSQHQNRHKAWLLLRARLAQTRRDAREEEMAEMRLSVAGVSRTGRGDKIRTYNWSQQRVTDHRSGITLNRLDDIVAGGPCLDEIMLHVEDWLQSKDVESMMADHEAAHKIQQVRKAH